MELQTEESKVVNAINEFKENHLTDITKQIEENLKKYGNGKFSICVNISDYHMDTNDTESLIVPTDKGYVLLHRVNINI